jgi:hypothetical protein
MQLCAVNFIAMGTNKAARFLSGAPAAPAIGDASVLHALLRAASSGGLPQGFCPSIRAKWSLSPQNAWKRRICRPGNDDTLAGMQQVHRPSLFVTGMYSLLWCCKLTVGSFL